MGWLACGVLQIFLSSSLHLSVWQWMEEEEGANGARRGIRTGYTGVRLYGHWQLWSGDGTAELRRKGKQLRGRSAICTSLSQYSSFFTDVIHGLCLSVQKGESIHLQASAWGGYSVSCTGINVFVWNIGATYRTLETPTCNSQAA